MQKISTKPVDAEDIESAEVAGHERLRNVSDQQARAYSEMAQGKRVEKSEMKNLQEQSY